VGLGVSGLWFGAILHATTLDEWLLTVPIQSSSFL
jgi:hypothetical protein